MKYAIVTFGCKVNQYESNAVSDLMKKAGYELSENVFDAEIVIINSCSVTDNSDKKVRQTVSRIRNRTENVLIALTGCFTQAFPDAAAKLDADIVIGTERKAELVKMIGDFVQNDCKEKLVSIPERPKHACYEEFDFSDTGMTRAYIKIEDGCDRFCSYCIIPYARGNVRSRSIESIRKEAAMQVNAGHKELILVGVNLSCYGTDIGLCLTDAVEAACESGAYRVRLSSLEPELMTESDVKRMSELPELCPHFHLSLQSGSAETLKRMNRHYTPDEYYGIVQMLRRYFPDCSITTDVMVGFAGESDEEFEESLAFCRKVGFSAMHVFTYSVREGTVAARRSDFVDPKTAQMRYERMTSLAAELREKRLRECIGKEYEVLIQRRESEEYANGLTANYLPVRIYGSAAKRHDVVKVCITGSEGNEYLTGKEM